MYYSRDFSISYDILNSFTYEGVNENDAKLFVFYTTDEDENDEWRIFRLPGNSALPTVTFTYPAQDLQVHSNETAFPLHVVTTTAFRGLPFVFLLSFAFAGLYSRYVLRPSTPYPLLMPFPYFH